MSTTLRTRQNVTQAPQARPAVAPTVAPSVKPAAPSAPAQKKSDAAFALSESGAAQLARDAAPSSDAGAAAKTKGAPRSGVGGAGVMPFSVANKLPPTHPAVAASRQILKLYEPKAAAKVDRPLERMLGKIAVLQEGLSGVKDPDKLIDRMMKTDFRQHAFVLDKMCDVYSEKFGKDARKAGEKVHELVASIGKLSKVVNAHKTAKEHGVPPKVLEYMQERIDKARGKLSDLLQEEWMPKKDGRIPALKDVVGAFVDAKWDRYATDRADYRTALHDRLTEIDGRKFDMGDLHNGIHELRKALRELPLLAMAADGLIQLDDTRNPVAHYKEEFLDKPLGITKYVTLPPSDREPSPIQFSTSLYYANLKFLEDLGDIKDKGECVELTAEAFAEVGLAKNEKQGKAQALKYLGVEFSDTHQYATARAVYDDVKEHGMVKALCDELAA